MQENQSQLSSPPPSSSPTPSPISQKVQRMLITGVKDMVYEVHDLIRNNPAIITPEIVDQLNHMIDNDTFVKECIQMLMYVK